MNAIKIMKINFVYPVHNLGVSNNTFYNYPWTVKSNKSADIFSACETQINTEMNIKFYWSMIKNINKKI